MQISRLVALGVRGCAGVRRWPKEIIVGWTGNWLLLLLAYVACEIDHIEKAFDFQHFGNFHDSRDLRFGDVHLARVNVFEQCSHLELLHAGENYAAVVLRCVLQNQLEIWRASCEDDAVCFELHVIVDVDGAIDVAFHLDERLQDLNQVRFVIVPSQAVAVAVERINTCAAFIASIIYFTSTAHFFRYVFLSFCNYLIIDLFFVLSRLFPKRETKQEQEQSVRHISIVIEFFCFVTTAAIAKLVGMSVIDLHFDFKNIFKSQRNVSRVLN